MKGVVAAGHEVTARAGAQMLRAGGNAFDAVLAAMLTACVSESVLASLGGGGFLMARRAATASKPETTRLYDFFTQTPQKKRAVGELDFQAIHADFGPVQQEFHIGAGASATPGTIPGLFAIHTDLCTLPLEQITEPAIKAARGGVVMSEFQAYLFTVIKPILTHSKAAHALFAPKDSLLAAGQIFRNPQFADTLEKLAHEGEDYFRNGELGVAIVRQSQQAGGHITLEDLQDYKVERRTPLVQTYRDHRFYLNPAPAAGGPLSAFSLQLLQQICPGSSLPDLPDLIKVLDLTNRAREQKQWPLENFANVDHVRQQLELASAHPPQKRGTTHISVIDEKGNAAALTISNGEGNGLMLQDSGIMLNNMLGEEDLHDRGFHAWPQNRRLSSMMAPTLVEGPDKSLTALGSGGSNRIRSAILQVACNLVDRHMELEKAVQAPRLHVEKCGTISFENAPTAAPFGSQAKKQLREAFPDARQWPQPNMFFGGAHSARADADGQLHGAGDPRRDGISITIDK